MRGFFYNYDNRLKIIKSLIIFFIFFMCGIGVAKVYSNMTKPVSTVLEINTGKITANDSLPILNVFDLEKNLNVLHNQYKDTGKTILYFYTLNCNSCVTETIALKNIYEKLDVDYKLIGIVYSSEFEQVNSFIRTNSLYFDHFLIDRININKLKDISWPEVLLVDNSSNIVIQRYSGPNALDSLESIIYDLMN